MMQIFTIGYEGASIEDFVETLKLLDVTVLLDTRQLAISRRKGFAKNALRQALETAGIAYRHEASLGSPKELRDKFKRDKDQEYFFARYDDHLSQQRDLLLSLAKDFNDESSNVALMCFERDHRECHRLSVARELGVLIGVQPRRLGVQGDEQRAAYKRAHSHSSKGVSST